MILYLCSRRSPSYEKPPIRELCSCFACDITLLSATFHSVKVQLRHSITDSALWHTYLEQVIRQKKPTPFVGAREDDVGLGGPSRSPLGGVVAPSNTTLPTLPFSHHYAILEPYRIHSQSHEQQRRLIDARLIYPGRSLLFLCPQG